MAVLRVRAAAAAALLAALALAPAASARSWHGPIVIAPLGTSPGPPAAALGRSGEAIAAWTAAAGPGRGRVEVRVRRAHVAPWERQFASGTFARTPVTVVAGLAPDGASVVAWRIPSGSVRAAVRDRRSGTWRVLPVPSGAPASSAFFGFSSPRLVVGPGGAATLAWAAREADGWVVRGARRPAGGAWRELPPLVVGQAAVSPPALALGGPGDAVASWYTPAGPAGPGAPLLTGPLRAAVRAGAGAWGAPAELSASGYSPSASVAGGRALVVWEERAGSDFAGAVVRLASGGVASGAWSAPVTPATGRSPMVVADTAGDVLLSWAGPAGAGAPAPFLASLRPASAAAWPAPAALASGESLSAIEAAQARIAMGARGRGFTSVTDPEGPGSATTTLATSPAGGAAWDILPLQVGSDDADVALAAAASGDGLALVPVSQAVSGGDVVVAVDYDGAPRPVLRSRVSGRRRPDGTVAWSVTLRNEGRVAAQGVRLRLSVCCGTRLVSSRPAGVLGTRPWVGWRLGSLGVGRATTVRLVVRPSPRGVKVFLNGEAWAVAVPRTAVRGDLPARARVSATG